MLSLTPSDPMRLSDYTDYTMRVLMYCAAHPDRLVTIAELADAHQVSKNHLMKIVNDLAHQGVIETTRGRGGGLRLLKRPADVRIGDVVRGSETDFRMVECFDASTGRCTLAANCRLKSVFQKALQAYLRELDGVTLADIAGPLPPTAKPGAAPVRLSRKGAVKRPAAPRRPATKAIKPLKPS